MDRLWTPAGRAQVDRMTRCSAVGSPEAVLRGLEEIVRSTGADELILALQIDDHEARLRSYEIAAGLRGPRDGAEVRPGSPGMVL
jgi:alkanesulfonate monooxygenase SsuD/methylene tetrahydromethanopterin reductase-like flavin-dependent oxidoreductase (luciferase family)